MPLPRWARGSLAAAAVLLAASGLWLALDLDRDGASALAELRGGTSPWLGDSDGDGLRDGWEAARAGVGLSARHADSDGDGVLDAAELEAGADPGRGDSDRDGLADREEAALPDCDGDGAGAVAEGDGDADGRLDALEPLAERCDADVDGDGVADGSEGNAACVRRADCDRDGIADGEEAAAAGDGFDPLDPDSFGAGVSDAVSYAFLQSGQRPGADADRDGIPDGWESSQGLIAWGDLQPQPGARDLLVEVLRVNGPDSGRFADLSFAPAYEAVAAAFQQERGIRLRWTETVVDVPEEADPPLLPSLDEGYYRDVLARGRHSGNPYVTTVVLNPQHDQSQVLHAGVAPIRGMLAAVDYGSHVRFTFQGGGLQVSLFPVVESMVRGGRQGLLAEYGLEGGFTQQGEMGLRSTATGRTYVWQPSWFVTPPRVLEPGEDPVHLVRTSIEVDQAGLASTMMHELGHTLGLCHAHDAACSAAFTAADRAAQATSTMSYDAPPGALHFLGSEWERLLGYVACPPEAPVREVAEGAPQEAVLAAKYDYSDDDLESVDLRACDDLTPVARQFAAGDPPARTYRLPGELADPPAGRGGGPGWTLGYAIGMTALAAAACVAAAWGRGTTIS